MVGVVISKMAKFKKKFLLLILFALVIVLNAYPEQGIAHLEYSVISYIYNQLILVVIVLFLL